MSVADAYVVTGKAWSGSWLGYHSKVYYKNLSVPPPGARFSPEWGMMKTFAAQGSIGDWVEYRLDDITSAIEKIADNPNVSMQKKKAAFVTRRFEKAQAQVVSIMSCVLVDKKDDKFLSDISEKVKNLKVLRFDDFIGKSRPATTKKLMSMDMPAIQAGLQTPPHLRVLASVLAIGYPFTVCKELSKLSRRAASHLQNVEKYKVQSERIETNVFIGHGRSHV